MSGPGQHQFLHTAKYGHAGEYHTMRPQFVKKGEAVFKSMYHPDVRANAEEGEKAILIQKGDKLYATHNHELGAQPHALYEIRGDKIHTTMDHPQHDPSGHVFVLGGAQHDQGFIDKVISQG